MPVGFMATARWNSSCSAFGVVGVWADQFGLDLHLGGSMVQSR